MKVFIMTDLEGTTGVAGEWSDFNPGGREHESAKRLLTGDVNAAINPGMVFAENRGRRESSSKGLFHE